MPKIINAIASILSSDRVSLKNSSDNKIITSEYVDAIGERIESFPTCVPLKKESPPKVCKIATLTIVTKVKGLSADKLVLVRKKGSKTNKYKNIKKVFHNIPFIYPMDLER